MSCFVQLKADIAQKALMTDAVEKGFLAAE